MELKKQVCSLELAKRLKELGVKKESLFWWDYFGSPEYPVRLKRKEDMDFGYIEKQCSAFTVAELGELLPEEYWSIKSTEPKGLWACIYLGLGIEHLTESTTEADARAKMLVYLLENKLI